MMRLSVLDQSTATAGRSQDASIRETLELARHCEALGFHRFWVSEHHNHDSIVGSAPEVLVAAIAATTRRIRVGTAGVLLPHYPSLKVAEQFRVLEAIAPGRIDLGVGRAPGGDAATSFALNPHASQGGGAEAFPLQVQELLAWLSGKGLPEGHPLRGVRAHPTGPSVPETWILGSSGYGARLAAHLGLPYCFAHFITDGHGAAEALRAYQETYQPSSRHPAPYATVCVWALAAETEAEARHLFRTRERWRTARDHGVLLPMVPPEEAAVHAYTPAEQARIASMRQEAIVGTPRQVGERLRGLAKALDVQEITILTWTYDPEARRRSYALLAGEFGLGPS
jgi:luciferase family oxidoreductase group 1